MPTESRFAKVMARWAKPHKERSASGIGLLDYGLVGGGGALATWSAGQAIGSDKISLFCAGLVVVGTLFSYAVRRLSRNALWVQIDAFLYTLGACGAVFFSASLMAHMPDGGFPIEIVQAGWLSWMIIIGSFFAWRDSTLLFQAVPSIALFGLVGCYDTFRNVIFLFFGFLIFLATFFARAHGRQMLEFAEKSGYMMRADGIESRVHRDRSLFEAEVRAGPWRWIAGPEWALGSALVVVLVSFLGAPAIQASVQSVAGMVRLRGPRPRMNPTVAPFASGFNSGEVRVGRGPLTLTDNPVLNITMDRLHYLRMTSYDKYTGRGWTHSLASTGHDVAKLTLGDSLDEIADPVDFSFRVQMIQRLGLVPVPPEIASAPYGASLTADGSMDSGSVGFSVSGLSHEPRSIDKVTSARRDLPAELSKMTDTTNISPMVRNLARRVAKGARTDMAKATAIRTEIARDIVYSIKADATPENLDPAEYALLTSHVGYCDVFATVMVLMARSVGIPARYAVGYLPDQASQDDPRTFHAAEKDAHAWAELFFRDAGWIVFDATSEAASRPGEEVGAETEVSWYRRPWFVKVLDVSMLLVLIGGITWYGRVLTYEHAHPNHRAHLEVLYLEYVNTLQRLGARRRGLSATASEYLAESREHLGDSEELAAQLNGAFEMAMYGSISPTPETVASIRNDLRSLRGSVKRNRRTSKGDHRGI